VLTTNSEESQQINRENNVVWKIESTREADSFAKLIKFINQPPFSIVFGIKSSMDVPGSSSGSSSKRGRKLRQCSGEIRFQPMDSLSSVELETITNKVVFVLFEF
jgi:hypothetical protein